MLHYMHSEYLHKNVHLNVYNFPIFSLIFTKIEIGNITIHFGKFLLIFFFWGGGGGEGPIVGP